jgi:hypothetical protein
MQRFIREAPHRPRMTSKPDSQAGPRHTEIPCRPQSPTRPWPASSGPHRRLAVRPQCIDVFVRVLGATHPRRLVHRLRRRPRTKRARSSRRTAFAVRLSNRPREASVRSRRQLRLAHYRSRPQRHHHTAARRVLTSRLQPGAVVPRGLQVHFVRTRR